MKISLIVEGPSDEKVLRGQGNWFKKLGLEVDIHPTGGRPNMIKKAIEYYKLAKYTGSEKTIFLPDQEIDICPMITRQKIGIDSLPEDEAVTIVIKRELEAWILADGQCIRDSIGGHYHPAGQTDTEINSKEKLKHILKHKKSHKPTTMEAAKIVTNHFSITRAAINNTSAKRFKDFLENTSQNRDI